MEFRASKKRLQNYWCLAAFFSASPMEFTALFMVLVSMSSTFASAFICEPSALNFLSFSLPLPFFVLATQNPLELEGTYPLPEAQIDRFMLKIVVGYPTREEEDLIVQRIASNTKRPQVRAVASPQQILRARAVLDEVYVDELVRRYVLDLVFATRAPEQHGLAKLKPMILYGASPRASIALTQAARARAFLDGRGYVTPKDCKRVAMDVLRHRVVTTFEAEAEGFSSERIVQTLLDTVAMP